MKKINDMYNGTVSVDSPIKNDVSRGTTIGDSTKVLRDVNDNRVGPDIGVNIKGLVVNSGKGKGNIKNV